MELSGRLHGSVALPPLRSLHYGWNNKAVWTPVWMLWRRFTLSGIEQRYLRCPNYRNNFRKCSLNTNITFLFVAPCKVFKVGPASHSLSLGLPVCTAPLSASSLYTTVSMFGILTFRCRPFNTNFSTSREWCRRIGMRRRSWRVDFTTLLLLPG